MSKLKSAKKLSVKKQKIIEKTLSLVRENGYDGVSLNDVSEAVGLTKSGVYAHFSSKDELICGALDLSINQLREELTIGLTGTRLRDFETVLMAIASHLKTERKCVGLHLLYGASGDAGKINSGLHEFFSLLKKSLSEALYQPDDIEKSIIEEMVEDILSQLEGATVWLLLDDNPGAIDRAVKLGLERASALVGSVPLA